MTHDYLQSEIRLTRNLMNVEELLAFQLSHRVEVQALSDWQYACYIDGKQRGSTGLTPMYAMVTGVRDYMAR